MAVIDILRMYWRPLIGHAALVTALISDFHRRSSEGWISTVFSLSSLVGVLIGIIIFSPRPRLFFFLREARISTRKLSGRLSRTFSWIFVVGMPVLWLLVVIRFKTEVFSYFGAKFLGAYIFFAWLAAAAIVFPTLFNRR